MGMSKGERDELRRLTRQRHKVLREEIEARAAELTSEIEHRVAARFYERDQRRLDVESRVNEVLRRANDECAKILAEVDYQITGVGRILPEAARIRWDEQDKYALRRAAISDVDARVKEAKLKINRQEVDLLEQLALGAIESDEAKAFLVSLPTVAELVPAARMEELEAALNLDIEDKA